MLRNVFSVSGAVQLAALALWLSAGGIAPAKAGFFDFLFAPQGNASPRQSAPQQSTFDPFGFNKPAQQPQEGQYPYVDSSNGGGRTSAFCVRTCDGRYFPIQTSSASAAQICQSFCPASVTKVFFGGSVTSAQAHDGARYGELANAYLFRQKVVAGCTCNGRDGMGLAPVDLSLDQTLRPGDVVATTTGLVAYNGGRNSQAGMQGDFTPVSSYPGLTADVRTKLGEMKVAPAKEIPVDSADNNYPPMDDITASIAGRRIR